MSDAPAAPAEPIETTELAPRPEVPTSLSMVPTDNEMRKMKEIAHAAAGANLVGVVSADQAFCKILAGRELGLSPMASLREIDSIPTKGGRITLSINARCQVALVRRYGMGDITIMESTEERARVRATRANNETLDFLFTMDDAKRAGLSKKNNWRDWPKSMLLARAQSEAVKAMMQEAFLGIAHTPDELGAETNEDGRFIDVELIEAKPEGPPAGFGGGRAEATATTETADAPAESVPVESPPSGPMTSADMLATAPSPEPAESPKPPTLEQEQQLRLWMGRLKMDGQQWGVFLKQAHPGATSFADCTVMEAEQLILWLTLLDQGRKLREQISYPVEKWAASLAERGVTSDLELPFDAALDIFDKLVGIVTPETLKRLGIDPAPWGANVPK